MAARKKSAPSNDTPVTTPVSADEAEPTAEPTIIEFEGQRVDHVQIDLSSYKDISAPVLREGDRGELRVRFAINQIVHGRDKDGRLRRYQKAKIHVARITDIQHGPFDYEESEESPLRFLIDQDPEQLKEHVLGAHDDSFELLDEDELPTAHDETHTAAEADGIEMHLHDPIPEQLAIEGDPDA